MESQPIRWVPRIDRTVTVTLNGSTVATIEFMNIEIIRDGCLHRHPEGETERKLYPDAIDEATLSSLADKILASLSADINQGTVGDFAWQSQGPAVFR